MSSAPTVPAGDVAVTEPGESAVMVAVVVPNFTAVAAERLVPVMVTDVPPLVGPLVGLISATVGEPRTMAASIRGVVVNEATVTERAEASVALALNHWVE